MIKQAQLDAFYQGRCFDAYTFLGAHPKRYGKASGMRFTVYAPNAEEVELVGEFNDWKGANHKMKRVHNDFFTIFVSGIGDYVTYKYHIRTKSNEWIDKADPYGFFAEKRPNTASKTFDLNGFEWTDSAFLNQRTINKNKPVLIYEVHAGSWKLKWDGNFHSYDELADHLIPYVLEQGFTHIELMPLLENPLDMSWGYLCTGYFSATSRYGNPKQLMNFINRCHEAGLGVIMDFVPVHFIKDNHGLHLFDGTPLYEYGDEHRRYSQWGSVNFNLFSETVRSFLLSSANFWIEYFHVDGIRYDAVSNLIYWNGNTEDGANPGAHDYITRNNHLLHDKHKGVMLIAEDSSAYQGVTSPTFDGGLGFDYKWDLGWMNDTLKFYEQDPIYRKHNHDALTFSMHYFYSENFLLPLSHDEVVHGKGSIINKMWGDFSQKFSQVRNLYTYMYTHPGKKLLFMGNELGTFDEWNEASQLTWRLLEYPVHQGIQRMIRDLNVITKEHPALHANDYEPDAFTWLIKDDTDNSVFAFARDFYDDKIVVVLNMTPTNHDNYKVGVPWEGKYEEIFNSDKEEYGGGNGFNYHHRFTNQEPLNEFDYSFNLRIAPFSASILFLK